MSLILRFPPRHDIQLMTAIVSLIDHLKQQSGPWLTVVDLCSNVRIEAKMQLKVPSAMPLQFDE